MNPNAVYAAVSSQLSLIRRMDAIAQNIANVNTAGYKAQGMKFHELVNNNVIDEGTRVSFVSGGKSYVDTRAGTIHKTNNPFDVALRDDRAWFAIQTPRGVVYTRDGRMNMLPDGQLVNLKGYPYLDQSGSPLQLKPSAGKPIITSNGQIYQDGNSTSLGDLGVFVFPEGTRLRRAPDSSVVGDKSPLPLEDRSRPLVVQGFIEDSNVNGVNEMTHMITVNRAFEQVDSLLRVQEESSLDAIKTLGTTY